MRYTDQRIVFQEVPDEVSLAFLISGCQLRCHNCHSVESWSEERGILLDSAALQIFLEKSKDWATCVLFLGGEWFEEKLIKALDLCLDHGFKTALYTGLDDVSYELKNRLHYLKTGPYLHTKGGLDSPHTNQKLINLKTGENLNYKFNQSHGGKTNDTSQPKPIE